MPQPDPKIVALLDKLGRPDAVTLAMLAANTDGALKCWLSGHRVRRIVPRLLERCGYERVTNPEAKDGLWRINYQRQRIYARADLPADERLSSVFRLSKSARQ